MSDSRELKLLFALSFMLLPFLAGCGTASGISGSAPLDKNIGVNSEGAFGQNQPAELTGQTDQASNQNQQEQGTDAYKTLCKDGVDWRQGRYESGRYGGRLLIASCDANPKTFNPWVAEDAFSLELSNLLFRPLLDLDAESGKAIPDLALEMKVSDDKLSYLIAMRKGLKWSDGEDLDANDVLFTWNKIIAQDLGCPSLKESFLIDGKLPGCELLDKYHLRFRCPKPYAPFARLLCLLRIAPRHAIEPVLLSGEPRAAFKQLWSAESDLSTIVSDGPFKLFAFEPGQKVEFMRWDNFYMLDKKGNRLPYLDRVVYTLAPDQGAVLLSFDKKEADLARFRPRDFAWLKSQELKERFKLFDLGPQQSVSALVFNMNRRNDSFSGKPLVSPEKTAWFNDRNFRQAIDSAIDKSALINSFYKGAASLSSDLCQANKTKKDKANQASPGKDLKKALTLLAGSGFEKRKDGNLYDCNGRKVEFELSYLSKSKYYAAAAESIARDLKELGIELRCHGLEQHAAEEQMRGARLWDTQLISLSFDPVEANSYRELMASNGKLHLFDQREPDKNGKMQVKDKRDWEEKIDSIYEQAALEFDEQKRKELYAAAEKIMSEETPIIYLVTPNCLLAARNNLGNFRPTALSQSILGLHNLEEIYLLPEKTASGQTVAEVQKENGG